MAIDANNAPCRSYKSLATLRTVLCLQATTQPLLQGDQSVTRPLGSGTPGGHSYSTGTQTVTLT